MSSLLIGNRNNSNYNISPKGKKNFSTAFFLSNPTLVKKYGFWGDSDGDGVLNAFDCFPFDKKRQDVPQISTAQEAINLSIERHEGQVQSAYYAQLDSENKAAYVKAMSEYKQYRNRPLPDSEYERKLLKEGYKINETQQLNTSIDTAQAQRLPAVKSSVQSNRPPWLPESKNPFDFPVKTKSGEIIQPTSRPQSRITTSYNRPNSTIQYTEQASPTKVDLEKENYAQENKPTFTYSQLDKVYAKKIKDGQFIGSEEEYAQYKQDYDRVKSYYDNPVINKPKIDKDNFLEYARQKAQDKAYFEQLMEESPEYKGQLSSYMSAGYTEQESRALARYSYQTQSSPTVVNSEKYLRKEAESGRTGAAAFLYGTKGIAPESTGSRITFKLGKALERTGSAGTKVINYVPNALINRPLEAVGVPEKYRTFAISYSKSPVGVNTGGLIQLEPKAYYDFRESTLNNFFNNQLAAKPKATMINSANGNTISMSQSMQNNKINGFIYSSLSRGDTGIRMSAGEVVGIGAVSLLSAGTGAVGTISRIGVGTAYGSGSVGRGITGYTIARTSNTPVAKYYARSIVENPVSTILDTAAVGGLVYGGIRYGQEIKVRSDLRALERQKPELSLGLQKTTGGREQLLIVSKKATPKYTQQTMSTFKLRPSGDKTYQVEAGKFVSIITRNKDKRLFAQQQGTFSGRADVTTGRIIRENPIMKVSKEIESSQPVTSFIKILTREENPRLVKSFGAGLVKQDGNLAKVVYGDLSNGRFYKTGNNFVVELDKGQVYSSPIGRRTARLEPRGLGLIKRIKDTGNEVSSGGVVLVKKTKDVGAVVGKQVEQTASKLITNKPIVSPSTGMVPLTFKVEQTSNKAVGGVANTKTKTSQEQSLSGVQRQSIVMLGSESSTSEKEKSKNKSVSIFRPIEAEITSSSLLPSSAYIPAESSATSYSQDTSPRQAQKTKSIQTPSPVPPIRPVMPVIFPEETIVKNRFDRKRKKKEEEQQAYDTFVLIDSTKGNRARWLQVADNVSKENALSIGAGFVDRSSLSSRFKIVSDKGEINESAGEGIWSKIGYKFRDYMVRKGTKIQNQNQYIEKRKYRLDSQQEKYKISQARASSLLIGGRRRR